MMTAPNAPVRCFYFTTLLLVLAGFGLVPTAHGQAGLDVDVVNVFANEPAEAVTVRITNEAIGFDVTRVTNADGRVRLAGLSTSGTYTVRVPENDRFYTAEADGVSLRSNFTKSVRLLVSPISEVELSEVVVEGRRGVADVNQTNAEVSSSLSGQSLEEIPVEGRNVTQSLFRLPNVTPSTGFYPEAPNVSINGANGLFTQYLVDGMDNNENFLGGPQFEVPTGMVKDVTVLTSTYSAEYGRTGNGIFNVTTKSGSNQFEGEAFYLTRPGQPIDGEFEGPDGRDLAQRDLSGNQVKNGFQRHQGGFSLGGPVVEDQTFFFVNVEHTTDWKDNTLNVPQLGLNQQVQGQNHFTYVSGRLDHNWSDAWRSTARVNVNRVRIDRQGGGLDGGVQFASAANTQQRDGVHAAVQTTYSGDRLVYESNVQYSRFRWNYANAEVGGPQVTMRDPGGATIGVLGDPGFRFNDLENTVQVQQKVTLPLGAHTLKAGLDVQASDFSLASGGNPAGNYTVNLTQTQVDALRAQNPSATLQPEALLDLPGTIEVAPGGYNVEIRPATFGTRQDLVGVYLEDQFSPIPDLNVTAGVRWDYDSLSKSGGSSGDWNNVAPRLSLNYALGAQSSLRGGYGIFYDKIVYSVYSDALAQNTTAGGFQDQLRDLVDRGILPEDTDLGRVTFDGVQTASATPAYLEGPTPDELQSSREDVTFSERRILNPNGWENPYTHQFSVGYQRQFGGEVLVYVDLIHTRSFNLFRLRDLNAPDRYDVSAEELEAVRQDPTRTPEDLVRSVDEADATRPASLRPGGARSIFMTETAGEARYYAANVNLVKDRGDDLYSGRLSYTLSRLRNNTDDINFRAEDANDFDDEWGPSVNDRTHVISAVGSVYPVDRLTVTLASLIQSGQPINRVPDAEIFGTRNLNGDVQGFTTTYTGNTDRWPGADRNGDRLPWSTTFDLSVQFAQPVTGGRVVVRADVFNVLNTKNLSGYANNATQSNQIQTGPPGSDVVQNNAGPPRQFQFGVRYEF